MMKEQFKEFEIPFGAKDSELCGWEYTIPEGMEATIVDNKIVVKKKDSEDERVRKFIIKIFKDAQRDGISEPIMPKQYDKIFAWLENRGEQKPAVLIPKFKVGDVMRTLQEAADNITDGLPVVVFIDNEYYHCNNEIIAIKDQDEYEYPPMNRKHDICDSCDEQKHAWSEEDERIYQSIIDDTVQENQLDSKQIDFLKSIKDRVQPKVELTQLDKNILEAAIAFVEQNNHFNCWRGVDKHTVLSALRSLKPQSTWKPSGAQMKQLGWIAEQNKDNMIGKELMSLYQDLKKLMEE